MLCQRPVLATRSCRTGTTKGCCHMTLEASARTPIEVDVEELAEWRDSVDGLVVSHGDSRCDPSALGCLGAGSDTGAGGARRVDHLKRTTDYVNTIPPGAEPVFHGDAAMEARIRHYVR